jgi:glutamine amidotransferase
VNAGRPSIAVLDYRAGNLTSVLKALRAAGADAVVTDDPEQIAAADGIVIPGVGHFAATRAIGDACRTTILRRVGQQVPLLGICLGMQFLFEGSEEAPGVPGLALFRGRCALLPSHVKVPHVGWNDLNVRPSRLLAGIPDGVQAYFTHSFAAPITPETVATTVYGSTFAAVVELGNVFGVQFHPETSSKSGLQILRSFVGTVQSSRCSPSA